MEEIKNKYYVVVRCRTYNQASYIKDTMNGFVMQQTNFPFVCCIMDDASTDGEQTVIRCYLKDNFDLDDKNFVRNEETNDYQLIFARHKINKSCFFAVYFLKYNHYGKKSILGYEKEWQNNSRFIAICEGDDYWIDNNKLQKQVDVFNKNSRIGLCYTNAEIYNQKLGKVMPSGDTTYRGLKLLIYQNPVMTLTTMFKVNLYNEYLGEVRPEQRGWKMGDLPLWIWLAANSEVAYIDEVTSVYRYLEKSASHSKDAEKQVSFLLSIYDVQSYFVEKYFPDDEELITKIQNRTNRRVANAYEKYNRIKFLDYINKVQNRSKKENIKRVLYSFPPFYMFVRLWRDTRISISSMVNKR